MTRAACNTPSQELLEYWLGELDESSESRVDEHLFGCAACTDRLQAIVGLGAAIRRVFASGALNIVLPESFINNVKDAGFHVREYRLEPGGAVDCTITPEDDFVVAHLRAPLRGIRRLDVLIDNQTVGKSRANDVAFDPNADGLVTITSSVFLRTLRHSRQRVQLVAVDGAHERVVADYTFNHYPS
jgi:hypothetical protein